MSGTSKILCIPMHDNRFRRVRARIQALLLAAGLVGWSFVSPRLPAVWRVALQAGVATKMFSSNPIPSMGISTLCTVLDRSYTIPKPPRMTVF